MEARHDGRLGQREVASVERHLAACAECAALAGDLRVLRALARQRAPELPAVERQRARVRLLQAAAIRDADVRRAVARPLLAAGSLALAAAALALTATALRPSDRPSIARVHALTAKVQAYRVTAIRPAAGTRFADQSTDDDRIVTLDDGALDITVRPLAPHERFIVRMADAEVEVRGTRFRVEAAAGRIRRVAVTDGKVEVRHGATRSFIEAGETWSTSACGPYGEAAEITPPEERAISPRAAAGGGPAERPGHRPARAASNGHADASTSGRRTSSSDPEPRASAPELAPDGSVGRAASDEVAEAADESADASAEFRAAVRAVEGGDYGAAAERLRAFVRRHPEDARAEDAAFLEVLSLARAGRTTAATRAARAYLAHFPNGYRRAEAERIAAGK